MPRTQAYNLGMNSKSSNLWTAALTVIILVLLAVQISHWRTPPGGTQQQTNGPEDSLGQMLKSGVMSVGYIDYPPAVIKDPKTGELSGEFVEIARYIAKELKLKIEFHEASWSTFITGLQTKQYDISIAPTYIRVSRAANIAYSQPIAYLGNSAGVRQDDNRF